MALDRNTLRERLRFYRELGVGPLYRRETSCAGADLMVEPAAVVDSEREAIADETVLMPAKPSLQDRESQLKVILDDIGPNCQRCAWPNSDASRSSSAPETHMPS